MKKETCFWNTLIIAGAILIIGWALLKSFGIINSPEWVEMVPYFGAGASILGAAYTLGRIKKGIDDTETKVNKILDMGTRFNKLENEHNLVMNGKLKSKH